jgi:CubicO group peptidase (beta-lactamase class C family)
MERNAPWTAEQFAPVRQVFDRWVARTPGGGSLVVRVKGETVVDLWGGTMDRHGERPWGRETLGLSFSTTKGIASTVIHRLADRGLLDYDEPVATYWPEFGAGGKEGITVRDVLTHRAGLFNVRAVAKRAEDLLDHLAMEERLAALERPGPTRRSAYHAITYGWLVAGIARRVTGKGMAELAQVEVAKPLGADGLHIGIPSAGPEGIAEPVGDALRRTGVVARLFSPVWTRIPATKTAIEALLVPGFHRLFEGPEPSIWTTEMPAVNGALTADGLARLYGALANGGEDDGKRLLSRERVKALGKVQVRTADAVLGFRMRWRLGYHQAFGRGGGAPLAFGHYGYGGSGGWADPATGMSLGFVSNKIGSLTTPMGDFALFRLTGLVRECAALGPRMRTTERAA